MVLPKQPSSFEVRQLGEVLTVLIDRKLTLCLTVDDFRFLYELPHSKSC